MIPEDVRVRAVEMYASGMSTVKVGEALGISSASVARFCAGIIRHPDNSIEAMRADPQHPSHGTLGGYARGCRCEKCRLRRKIHDKKMQVKRVLAGKDPW